MGRIFTASYISYLQVNIPKNLPLLSVEHNEAAKEGVPWSWYIRWGVLHYMDADGKEHQIEGGETCESDYKRPDNVKEEDDGEDDSDVESDGEDCEKDCMCRMCKHERKFA